MSTHVSERSAALAIHDAVRGRRSIRAFTDRPIPRRIVEDVLRDALWSPSPHNSQPWRFTVLFDEGDKARLADAMAGQLASELAAERLEPSAIERQTLRSRRRISAAPVVVLCSLVADGLVEYPDRRRSDLEWQMAVQSVGAVLQSLFLLASAHDIGTCWMAAPMYCPGVVRAACDLPGEWEPQALALLGYVEKPGKIRERRSFEEIVDLR